MSSSSSFLPPIRSATCTSSLSPMMAKLSPKNNKIIMSTTVAADQQNHSPSSPSASTSRSRHRRRFQDDQHQQIIQHNNVVSPPTNHIIADAILDKINDQITQERLIKNQCQRGQVEYQERTAREELTSQFYEYFDLLHGHLAYIEDRSQKKKPIHARATVPGFCLSRLEQRIADQAKKDQEHEMWCRKEGKKLVEKDQEKAKADIQKREEMKRRLREDMAGFRAAGVFLIAEEGRQRAMLDNEMGNNLYNIRKRFTDEEAQAMKAVADREAREAAARREVVAAAKKEAQALEEKRQAEVRKRQEKLIGKCTHARNGASVFTGPYPKKMCLICRIKLDPLSGLYVVMEKGAKG